MNWQDEAFYLTGAENIQEFERRLEKINIEKLQQELDQYKNNWEELKKWLEFKKEQYATNIEWLSVERISNVLDKMKELEEDK